jgi:glycosyltransferase involved in cell wall biosynthesis
MTSLLAETGRQRLLVLASTYPRWKDDPEPGFVHELARRLTSEFDVLVVCPGAQGALRSEIMDGVRVRRFRYAPPRLETLVNDGGITTNLKRSPWKYLLVPLFLAGMAWATASALRRHRPHVIHAHWLLPQGLLARMLSRKSVPVGVTSHGADLFAWKGSLFQGLKKSVLQHAAAITVVSRPMVGEVVRLGAKPGSVSVAPMGVDLREKFSPDEGVPRSRSEILFVGRLVEKKGLRHLIDAMPAIIAGVPEATLAIAGFGPEQVERQAQVDRLGIGNAVRFLGPVRQDALPGLYRRAAVFVAPFIEASSGDQEGFGLVSLEAAGCGCPIVVSDTPVVRDVFDEREVVFAPPGDAEALAQRVVQVLQGNGTDPAQAREGLVAKYDWSVAAERYSSILRSAASGGR